MKELAKLDMESPSSSILNTFEIFQQFLETEFKILQVKQWLYLKLLSIYRDIPENTLSSFVLPIQLEQEIAMYAGQRPGNRSVYIRSHTFNQVNNRFLLWLLRSRSIKGVILSFDAEKINKGKMENFLALADETLSIDALVEDSGLIQKKTECSKFMNEISGYNFKGVHFNIEPYVSLDGEIKRSDDLKIYIDVLRKIKKFPCMQNKKLSISIPVFCASEYLETVFPIVDNVFIIIYQRTDIDTICELLKEKYSAQRKKIGIVLKMKNFKSEKELEDFTAYVIKKTECKFFVFDSLSEFFKKEGIYGTQKKTGFPAKD